MKRCIVILLGLLFGNAAFGEPIKDINKFQGKIEKCICSVLINKALLH